MEPGPATSLHRGGPLANLAPEERAGYVRWWKRYSLLRTGRDAGPFVIVGLLIVIAEVSRYLDAPLEDEELIFLAAIGFVAWAAITVRVELVRCIRCKAIFGGVRLWSLLRPLFKLTRLGPTFADPSFCRSCGLSIKEVRGLMAKKGQPDGDGR